MMIMMIGIAEHGSFGGEEGREGGREGARSVSIKEIDKMG